jgi:hypothetical protein
MAALQIMDLLDKTVDKTVAFIRAECKENIVSVDINLVDRFLQRNSFTIEIHHCVRYLFVVVFSLMAKVM